MPGTRSWRYQTDRATQKLTHRRNAAHARGCYQPLDCIAKGRKHLLDAEIESGDVSLQLLDQAEVMVEKESMMCRHAAIEGFRKIGARTLQADRSECMSLAEMPLRRAAISNTARNHILSGFLVFSSSVPEVRLV